MSLLMLSIRYRPFWVSCRLRMFHYSGIILVSIDIVDFEDIQWTRLWWTWPWVEEQV